MNGLRHGKGKLEFANGQFYDGDWKENEMDGKSKLVSQFNKNNIVEKE